MYTAILESEDKQFIFEFSFSPDFPLGMPTPEGIPEQTVAFPPKDPEGNPYVEMLVYRADLPEYTFHWVGYLTSEKIAMEVPVPPVNYQSSPPVPDVNGCTGEFHLYLNTESGGQYVWFDLRFGNDFELIYEGCMVTIPAEYANPGMDFHV